MDAPISSDAPSSLGSGPAADLVEQHRRLRARLLWLLPAGAMLLLLMAYQLATYPERTALSGYRFQQVGVQPDSTWWLLAYRDGKAEVLFSRDTARGWQRRELGVDSAQARSLALNWGGKALLVGDGGAVRVYDSLFQPLDSVRYPLGNRFRARWVAVDNSGQQVIALGDSGKTYTSQDGGYRWDLDYWPYYWFERAAFSTDDELCLANRFGDYIKVSIGAKIQAKFDSIIKYQKPVVPSLNSNHSSSNLLSKAEVAQLAPTTNSVPIIYFKPGTTSQPLALRQDGSAESGKYHYRTTEITANFPAAAKLIDAAFSPTRPGFCLLISRTRVFAGRLGGPFTSGLPAEAEPRDSTAARADSLKPAKNQVSNKSATQGKKQVQSTSTVKKATTTKKATSPAQKKGATKSPLTKKSESSTIPMDGENAPNTPIGTGDNTGKNRTAGEGSNTGQGGKMSSKNPVQQTTAPPNQNYQQATPPANNLKEKETTPPKPVMAR